jgi:hypothetical protein
VTDLRYQVQADTIAAAWADVATQALIGVATILVAVAALYVARRAHRTDKESFLTEIRREWEALSPDWNRCLMYLYGADQYYHSVDPRERAEHRAMVAKFVATRTGSLGNDEWTWRRDHRPIIARISRFLAYASDALITGRWTLREAYALFGPHVARHYGALIWMSHRMTIADVPSARPGGDVEWGRSIDSLPERNMFDSQDSLVVLGFLLRAEQCRRGDTHAHFVAMLATQLRGGWGRNVRRALYRASRSRGRWWPRVRLLAAIHRAEHPWKRSAYQFERTTYINPGDRAVFARPWETALGNFRRIQRTSRDAEF